MDGLFSAEKPLKEKAEDFVKKWQLTLEDVKAKGGEKQLCQLFWMDIANLILNTYEGLEFEKKTPSGGYVDVYSQKYGFIVEQKSKGVDLDKPEVRQSEVTPFEQAKGYNDSFPSDYKVSTIVTSNFERFRFYNLRSEEGMRGEKYEECALEEVPEKLELFIELFHSRPPKEEYSILDAPSTEKAAEKISKLYSLFAKEIDSTPLSDNAKSRYKKQIPLIIMRMVFLLFANNTSQDRGKIFKYDQFRTFLEKSTDDTHFARDLLDLFRCLDIPETDIDSRFTVMPEVRNFPYVDGGLFKSDVEFPQFPEGTRKELLDLVNDFKYWDRINISVFGPIMDCVFGGAYRRENGIYYTSKENIEKVIRPLFMDDLEHELEEIRKILDIEKQRNSLEAFHDKLSRLQFFDPACGSGNFLTETYMELRALEDEVIDLENSSVHDLDKDVRISLSQFHGIELDPYAVTVAKTALQIAREEALELSYKRFENTVSIPPHFLPLRDEVNGIVCGNALEMDWGDLVTPSKDLFIFGNPPFAGDYNKSKEQQTEMKRIFANLPSSELDYCAAWYYKAAKFLNDSGARFSFVSTNSITQGAQVRDLFKPIFELGWKIAFAYSSFIWDHRDAAVYVVIIGFSQNMNDTPHLYSDKSGWSKADNISPYLLALPTVFIEDLTTPISNLPQCFKGSEVDGKDLILHDENELKEARKDPIASRYVRLYLGAEELIQNKKKWCLWLVSSSPEERRKSTFLRQKIETVKQFRLASNRSNTKRAALKPWEFGDNRQPDTQYLAIPRVFSENRVYFTAGYESPDVIASDALFTVEDPDGFAFSVIESSMFMAWQDLVGGRLKEDNRFSNTLVWNTFPLPPLTEEQKDLIIEGGRKVLEARANYPSSSLADLYDPDNMPQDLRKAHEALDKAMDAVFSDKPFKSEEERQKALLEMYKKMTNEK